MEPNYNSPPPHHQYLYRSPQPAMFIPHTNLALNINHFHDKPDDDDPEKIPMFEKPLTPSDVGKLNRLVIPKQHAEKYLPLGGVDAGDKGLLLSFEDESGKCWRFRYSYWNSSQSYVFTKGWSRYVKEKQLDAGDVILFLRDRTDGHRLFIGWRRRGAGAAVDGGGVGNVVARNWSWAYQNPYLGQVQAQSHPTDCLHAGSAGENQTADANPRRLLRLFGVNLECHQPPPSTTSASFYSSNFMGYLLEPKQNGRAIEAEMAARRASHLEDEVLKLKEEREK